MFREMFTESAGFGLVEVYYGKPGSIGSMDTGGRYEVVKATKGKIVLSKVSGFKESMSTQTMDDDASIMPDTLDVKYKVNWKYDVSYVDIANALINGLSSKNYSLEVLEATGRNIIAKIKK